MSHCKSKYSESKKDKCDKIRRLCVKRLCPDDCHCPTGGVKITTISDHCDRKSYYVCNGVTGATGPAGTIDSASFRFEIDAVSPGGLRSGNLIKGPRRSILSLAPNELPNLTFAYVQTI